MAKVTRKTKEVVEIHIVLSSDEYVSLMCYLGHKDSRTRFGSYAPINNSHISQLRSDLATK